MIDGVEREIGLFAQDVEPLFPEAVNERKGKNEEGEEITYKTLSYIQLIPALIESIKELKQEIDQLKNEQGI
jgi:predicted S18 family serine protease